MASAFAAQSRRDEMAVMDSLRMVPPKLRIEWLYHRGIEMPGYAGGTTSDSGLRLVSKWGRGPAAEVTGKDTLVVLTLGSEVALLSFADPDSPRVLSEIQFPSLTAQSCLRDSLLYTSSNADLEVWNVADPTLPVKRGELLGPVGDFWIRDTFLYFIRRDTFHVFSIANPASPHELGSAPEAGSATSGSGNTVVVCQSTGFAFVDVSNPTGPHEVGAFPCGQALSAIARGNLVCASYEETSYPYPARFITLDITDPANPRLLARLNDLGGYDIYLDSSLAFVSGRGPGVENPQPFQILSIADSTHPAFTDSLRTTTGYPWGVWASLRAPQALVADGYDGLAVVDLSSVANPVLDTWVLKAGSAEDVFIDGTRCYVAGRYVGMKILDISNPADPVCLGQFDSALVGADDHCVAARDSFAYVCRWPQPRLKSVLVTDPANPQQVAACSTFNTPEDMVLRDSFLYIAEDYKFQVVNVARPREPVGVGTCNMTDGYQWGLVLQDTFAYMGSWDGLSIVNVSRPTAPQLVSQTSGTRLSTDGVAVWDTLAFVPSVYETLWVYSVANPAAPYPIAGAPLGNDNWGYDAAVFDDTLVFVGGKRSVVLVNVGDPAHPRVVGSYPAPSWVRRVLCSPPYLYACCTDAGVMILETTAVGVQEPGRMGGRQPTLHVTPNPAAEVVRVHFGEPPDDGGRLSLYDASGRRVLVKPIRREVNEAELNLTALSPGLYFVRIETKTGILKSKIVRR